MESSEYGFPTNIQARSGTFKKSSVGGNRGVLLQGITLSKISQKTGNMEDEDPPPGGDLVTADEEGRPKQAIAPQSRVGEVVNKPPQGGCCEEGCTLKLVEKDRVSCRGCCGWIHRDCGIEDEGGRRCVQCYVHRIIDGVQEKDPQDYGSLTCEEDEEENAEDSVTAADPMNRFTNWKMRVQILTSYKRQ